MHNLQQNKPLMIKVQELVGIQAGSNRWFKFVATTANITWFTGGTEGTLQYPYMALWQSNGTTQISYCKLY